MILLLVYSSSSFLGYWGIPKPGRKISTARTKRISTSSSSAGEEKEEPIMMPSDSPNVPKPQSPMKAPSKPKEASPTKKRLKPEKSTETPETEEETKLRLFEEFIEKENAFFKTLSEVTITVEESKNNTYE